MSSVGETGLRRVDLPKNHLAKGITAKADKQIGGPDGTHPNEPLRPLPDRLPLADQRMQKRDQKGTHMQPGGRTLIQAQENNQHVTNGTRGCMLQRVQRVVFDVPIGWQAHRENAWSRGGRGGILVCHHVRDGRDARPRLVSPTWPHVRRT